METEKSPYIEVIVEVAQIPVCEFDLKETHPALLLKGTYVIIFSGILPLQTERRKVRIAAQISQRVQKGEQQQ